MTAKDWIKIAAGILLTVLLVTIGFTVYKKTHPQITSATAQYDNVTASFSDMDKTMYDGASVSGDEVIAAIKNFANDDTCGVLVKTGDNYKFVYTNCSGFASTYIVKSGPQWVKDITKDTGALEISDADIRDIDDFNALDASSNGWIASSAKFTGSLLVDDNDAIRFIVFTAN